MIDFEWQQNPVLIKELNALDTAMRDRVMHLLLGRVVTPVVKQAKATAPSKSGALRQSIGRKKLNRKERTQQSIRTGDASVGVGATRKVLDAIVMAGGKVIRKRRSQAYKLRFFEEGTKAHPIPRKRAGFGTFFIPRRGTGSGIWQTRKTRLTKQKRLVFGGRTVTSVEHPGMEKNPFLTRSWKSHEPQMAGRFITELEKWVQKNASRQFS